MSLPLRMILEADLNPKQDDALTLLMDKVTRFLLFGGAAGGGKSWLGCVWLIIMCLTYPGTRWFIGRDELKKINTTTMITFGKVWKVLKLPKLFRKNEVLNFIEFHNGSRIDLLDLGYMPSDPQYERLGSYEFTGGWIEEGGEIHYIAVEMLKTRIGRHLNDKYGILAKILITGNPAKNWMYQLFYKPFKDGKLAEGYAFIRSLLVDNPEVDSGYQAMLQSLTDPIQRARLLHGSWEYESDPTALMAYDVILDAFTNAVDAGAKYMTVDVARFGRDKITIGIWEGWRCTTIYTRSKQSITKTADDIRQFSIDHEVPYSRIMIDEDGVGGGVVDLLPGCNGFTANASAIPAIKIEKVDGMDTEVKVPENYANLKSQCSFKFAERMNNRGVFIGAPDQILRQTIIEELEQVKRANPDRDAKLAVLSKDKVKEILQRSPDYADMLIMREAFDLLPREKFYQAPVMRHTTVVGGVPWDHIVD